MVSANNKGGNEGKEDKKGRGVSQGSASNSINPTNGHLSVTHSSTSAALIAAGAESGDEQAKEGDSPKRVGKAYQADIPELLNSSVEQLERCPERALLVWAPNSTLTDAQLEEYLWLAKDKYGYNAEQALGMLFWHRHDLERATTDLTNFTPFPDDWSTEDKVLFEQAFLFHGKSFSRIRQMLPDKSIAQLVKYYYLWKKSRQKHSLLDKHCKKHAAQLAAQTTAGGVKGEGGDGSVLDDGDRTGGGDGGDGGSGSGGKAADKLCSNCTVPANFLHNTAKGLQCLTCYNYWKRTGSLRPTVGPLKRDRQLIKHKRHPPPGMYINHEDLIALSSTAAPPGGVGGSGTPLLSAGGGSVHPVIKHVENEVVALNRQVQANKAELSYLRQRVAAGCTGVLLPGSARPPCPPATPLRLNAKWSNDELLLAVQGVRQYGRNFKAIAEIIGNKSENHVRSFFATHRKRYNLDQAMREWEQENTGPAQGEDGGEQMESESGSTAATTTRTAAAAAAAAAAATAAAASTTAASVTSTATTVTSTAAAAVAVVR